MRHVSGEILKYTALLASSLAVTGCFNGSINWADVNSIGVTTSASPSPSPSQYYGSIPDHLLGGGGPTLYFDHNGMPITSPFYGAVASSITVWAQAVDASGAPVVPVPSLPIIFGVVSGNGTLTSSNAMTDTQGRAYTQFLAPSLAGATVIQAFGIGANATLIPVVSNAGAPTQFVFAPLQTWVANTDMITGLVYATDAYQNIASSYVGSPGFTYGSGSQSRTFAAADQGRLAFSISPGGYIGSNSLSIADGATVSSSNPTLNDGPSSGSMPLTAPSIGNWSAVTSWSTNTVPTSTNRAFVTGTITLDQDGSAAEIVVNGSLNGTSHNLNIYQSDLSVAAGANVNVQGISFQQTGWNYIQEIINSGTITATNLNVPAGIFGVALAPGSGVTTISNLNIGSGSSFYVNGPLTVSNFIALSSGEQIIVGTTGTLMAGGGISVSNGAKLVVLPGGKLELGSSILSVTGSLDLRGTPTAPAMVDAMSGGTYSIYILNGGSFTADFFSIAHSAGVSVATGVAPLRISNGTFSQSSTLSPVISLASSPSAHLLSGLRFDDSANPGALIPIDASSLPSYLYASQIILTSAQEIKNGVADPMHLIVWDH